MAGEARQSEAVPDRARRYFVSGPVDFTLIGGLSIGLYGLFRWFPAVSPTDRMMAAGVLNVLLNWPHFSATSLRLYGSRRNISQYPATATIAPLLAAAGVVGSLLSPLTVAPVFIKVFMLWSFYHFSGQTIGITAIYARRFGFDLGRWERRAFSGFVFLTAISWAAASDSPNGSRYFGVQLIHFGLPPWAPQALRLLMIGFGVLVLLLVALSSVRQRRLPPAMMLLPAVTQFVWFVPGPEVPAFYEFVQALHSVQYLLIAWSMYLHETATHDDFIPGWRHVLSQSGRWGAINLFGGAALFWFLPRVARLIGADPVLAIGVISAGVQVHHFFVDGVIWKLRNKTTASPLMMSFRDLFDRPGRAVEPIPLVAGGTP